ncbi:MAG: glycosyltransferase [Synergistetes bacterium]|nr:glycosyltransferase [Synergistota bacterium]MCX8127257.1 glycosyltransferase [Synergistota bacterium]MDW8191857.1 glycosyltransferase [Synergistota bacterium]
MKALWILPYVFYPLRAGGQFSVYPWLKELYSRGWNFFLIQYNSPSGFLKESLKELSWAYKVLTVEPRRFKDKKSYLRALLLSDRSFFRLRNDIPEIYQALESASSSGFYPKIIILSHSYMGFLIPYLRKVFSDSKIIIDLHNLEWRAYGNLLNYYDSFSEKFDAFVNFVRLKEEEDEAFKECDGMIYLSPLEGKYLSLFEKPTLWRPARFPESRILLRNELLKNRDIMITSSLNVRWICEEILGFIKEVWLEYRKIFKEANFWVIGREPLEWFKSKALSFEGVHVLGWVDDLSPYIKRSRVFIAPFRKSMGSLTKIVSAWSWGIPVVTTSIVAKGLKGEQGKHFLVGSSFEELLHLCFKLAVDDELALRLSEESYNFVLEEYDLARFVDRFENWVKESFL